MLNHEHPTPPHSPDLSFNSPRAAIPDAKQQKTTVIVHADDYQKLDEWRNRTGTFTRTIAILTHKLVTALEQYGLDKYDPDNYERLVADCTILFPISATDRTPPIGTIPSPSQTPNPNDGRGVEQLPNPSPRPSPKRTAVKRPLRRGGSAGEGDKNQIGKDPETGRYE